MLHKIARLSALWFQTRRFLKFSKIYFCACDLEIPFDQLLERAISGSFLSAKFDKIQAIVLEGDIV